MEGNSNFTVENLENWYEHERYNWLNTLPNRNVNAGK
jgi:hypothetical protein